MSAPRPVVEAAGGVLWRASDGGREIAVIHRPRYDDWSLPKGKKKTGEELLLCAVREVTEETGHVPQVGAYLGRYSYAITSAGRPAVKSVKYWAMRAVGGGFEVNDEVDRLEWLDIPAALVRIDRAVDRKVLRAFLRLPEHTGVLLVIRNGSAVPASRRVDPTRRSLDRRGQQQAQALVPVLATLGIDTVLSSPARRCVQTLQPYAEAAGTAVELLDAVRHPETTVAGWTAHLLEQVGAGRRVAVCAEGVMVSRLLESVGGQLGAGRREHPRVKKGGWCLLHVGAGELLSVERQEAA